MDLDKIGSFINNFEMSRVSLAYNVKMSFNNHNVYPELCETVSELAQKAHLYLTEMVNCSQGLVSESIEEPSEEFFERSLILDMNLINLGMCDGFISKEFGQFLVEQSDVIKKLVIDKEPVAIYKFFNEHRDLFKRQSEFIEKFRPSDPLLPCNVF